MARVAIGFMGLPGAGKSYGAKVLAYHHDTLVVNMGDVVRTIARSGDELGPDANGEDIGNWVTAQLANDENAIISKVLTQIESMDIGTPVIIDGVRTLADYDGIQREFDEFSLVFIDADDETRLERLTSRGRDGEDEFTMADLNRRDERELSWGVSDLLEEEMYDYRIDNSKSRRETFAERLLNTLY